LGVCPLWVKRIAIGFDRSRAVVYSEIAARFPAQCLQQRLLECCATGYPFWIILREATQYADASHALALLRAQGDRPNNCRTAK
jgi:hypothetical protein